jgi:AraC family transcriptional regulator of adaptative response / DNA-3-methyladenine glycosylase II
VGQQVSVRAATTFAGRLAHAFGEPIATPFPMLTRLGLSADRVADAPVRQLTSLGLIASRAACILALARAVCAGRLSLKPSPNPEGVIAQLQDLPGIGPWTAHYVAMRALRWPDAFPHGDLALRRVLREPAARAVLRLAETWRPWRAYAAMHVWNAARQSIPEE